MQHHREITQFCAIVVTHIFLQFYKNCKLPLRLVGLKMGGLLFKNNHILKVPRYELIRSYKYRQTYPSMPEDVVLNHIMPYFYNSINNINTVSSISTLNHFFYEACHEHLMLLQKSKKFVDLYELNALHFAAFKSTSSVIKVLTKSMPHAEERLHGFDDYGGSILTAAIAGNNRETFDYLVTIDGLDLNKGTKNRNSLYFIVQIVVEGSLSETEAIYFLRHLITDEEVDVNHTCFCCENSVLHKALYSNRSYDFIKEFLDHPNIDLTVTNNKGSTLLHAAASFNSDVNNTKHILALMKSRSISINTRDDFGLTAYGRACLHGNVAIADLLKLNGGTQLAGFYLNDSGFIQFWDGSNGDDGHPLAIEVVFPQGPVEQHTDESSNFDSDDDYFGTDYEDDY